MQKTVWCAVLCLLVVATGSALGADRDAVIGPPVTEGVGRPASTPVARRATQPTFVIGKVDTIGGTTYDWQTNGPTWRWLVNSPGHGVHALWMYSSSTSGTTFPDRNVRYNFYDFTNRAWNWIGPGYMQSGMDVFTHRAGFGSIDADPASGAAIVGCHYQGSGGVTPKVAKDAASGAGSFDYADGEPVLGVCQWPPISVSQNGAIHIFPMTADYVMSYSHIAADSWPTFATPVTGIEPSPGFPTHNVAASKRSGKVCLVWEISTADPQLAYMQTSTNYGATWNSPAWLQAPTAYLGDTLTAFHITSLFPFYDNSDRLNIVANVCPEVSGTVYVNPSQIWHYCPDNSPQWNCIHIAGCAPENLQAPVGYNATYACRPSIGQDDDGNLFVAWEQFDSANVEPVTSRLRADIWATGSTDGGIQWATPLKLTTAGTASCRFPCICNLSWPGDSLAVVYEIDQCAGFFVQGEGPVTYNPVVVQKVPIDSLIRRSLYTGRIIRPKGGEVLAGGDTFTIMWTVTPKTFNYGVLSLSTDGGSTFPTVLRTSIPPAETTYFWDPIPQLNNSRCRVKFDAADSFGATVFSCRSDSNFTIDSDTPPAPDTVSPKDTAINNTSVVFNWNKVPDISGIDYYTVWIAYDSGFHDTVGTARCTVTTYRRLLPADTVYYWRVRATDRARHVGPWCTTARFEIDAQTPGTPTLREPVDDAWLRSPTVIFHWDSVQFLGGSGPRKGKQFSRVSYVLAVDTMATGINLWVDTTLLTTDTITLPWERRYWWQVRAYDNAGNRGDSTHDSFGVDVTPPPRAILASPPDSSIVGADTVRLIWRSVRDNISGVRHYHLQLARDTVFTETLVVTDTVRLETLPGDGAYYWRVRAIDSAGNVGQWSLRGSFTYSLVGVSENRPELGTEVRLLGPAPNPFARTTAVRLVLPREMPLEADVYNAAGQKVRSLASGLGRAGANSLVWNGTDGGGRRVQAGVYYLRITTESGTFTQAVVLWR